MSFKNVIFEKLSPAQLQELKTISRKTFSDAFASGNNPDDLELYLNTAFSEDRLREELLDPLSEFYFVKMEDETIGYFKINLGEAQTEFKEKDSMELERIYVKNEYQNKGLGQKMLDAVIEMAVQRKMRFLWLGVWEKNGKAIKFYQRNNFKITGSHPYMVGTDLQTDKIMVLELL